MANNNTNTRANEPISLISLNANGLGKANKRIKLIGWLKKFHNADKKIIFLQETHTTVRTEPIWNKEWNYRKIIYSHGTSGSKGVAIILPKNMNYEINNTKISPDGRYIALTMTINDTKFCLINGYAPNTTKTQDQLKWLSEIQTILQENMDTNYIIGGDLNDVFIPMLDRFRCKQGTAETEYVKAWKVLCEEFNLADFWRLLNPGKKSYTWRQGSSATRLKQSRLDYWLISVHLMYELYNVDIKASTGSDHSLIDIDFYNVEEPERGPSFWRFNASLLKDKVYVQQIKSGYQKAVEKYSDIEDKGLKWDLVKMELRSSTVCFSKNKAKETRDNIKKHMTTVNNLEKEINGEPTDEKLKQYHEAKQFIEDYNNEKAQGVCIRSKADWAEHGEKNTKFFLNLEKRNHDMKCITKLIDDEQQVIDNADKILEYEEQFYKDLYSNKVQLVDPTEREQAANTFKDDTLPKISEPDKTLCEQPITMEEIGKALKQLENGKSPGSDGFTTDFYKFFWPDIKNTVLESFNHANQLGRLSIDQRRGIINLIPKKNKDPRLLKNWRPISLLNTDYKIITKALANRIKKVLPTVINPDQVAYLKERFIGQNIRTIWDVLGYTKLMGKKGIIAFLDFEKAFDTIQWCVIYDALTQFNIGPNFINWVHTIYNESVACVTNNGFASPFFTLERGVRQGCPLSPYLFIVVVELLANKIRKDTNIKGIKIGTMEIKLVQMADDTTVFVNDPDSLENILKTLGQFEKYAGLKLNKTKTEAMWLGKDRNNPHTPLGIKWVKEVHSLGIFFSYNTDSVVLKNFSDRAKEFKRILDMWMQRDLSLIGKITILKSLAFSKVIYQCGVMKYTEEFKQTIIDIAYNFIWNYKPNKIRRNTLIAEYEKGGLKMLDINSFLKAQKAMWVKRLQTPDNASWKAAPTFYLQEFLGLETFRCNLECKTKPKNFPHFYWMVMESWFEIKKLTTPVEKSPMDIRRECLWLNKDIKIANKVINWHSWQEKGINILHDLLNEQGSFLTPKDLKEKYNIKINILNYTALKDAVPKKWRQSLKTMKIPSNAISFKEQIHIKIGKNDKPLNNITNKDLYWVLVRNIQEEPIYKAKLQFELKIKEEEWPIIYKIPRTIQDTKIRAFQYKLLFSLLPCNLYLHRIKKSNTDKCNKCPKLDDTAHYLFECEQVVPFWSSFMNWWNDMTGDLTFMDKASALTGFIGKHKYIDTLNACLLLAKWHVYKNKLNDSEIFFYNFLRELKYNLDTEKLIALRNDKLHLYTNKWQFVEDYIT
jgi:exonuclease III